MPGPERDLAAGVGAAPVAAPAPLQTSSAFGTGGQVTTLGIPRQTLESKIKALQIDKLSYQGR